LRQLEETQTLACVPDEEHLSNCVPVWIDTSLATPNIHTRNAPPAST